MSAQSAEQIGAAIAEEVGAFPALETPSQHIRNAMGSLYTLARIDGFKDVRVMDPTCGSADGEHLAQRVEGFFISDDTLCAVYRRLWKAVKDLEAPRGL